MRQPQNLHDSWHLPPHRRTVRTVLVLGLVALFTLSDHLCLLRLAVGRLIRPTELASAPQEEEEENKEESSYAAPGGAVRRLTGRPLPRTAPALPHASAPFCVAAAALPSAHQSPFHRLPRHGEGIPLRC